MNTSRHPIPSSSLTRACATIGLALLCMACTAVPQAPQVDLVQTRNFQPAPEVRPVAKSSSGSLFVAARYQPAFEDRRARMVGDSVTITILENVSATQSSKSTLGRTGGIAAGVTALPFVKSTELAKANINASNNTTFEGKGDTASTNTFQGTITTTVVEVLPNGHLVVAGEKQIGLNQNVDVLRFSGTVDPSLLLPGNVVNSTQVANARIQSRGRGAQDEAQTVGWLSRFFLTLSPF